MSSFRLQLWREWREHRTVLLAILLLLPVCAGLLCLPIPRGQLGDPVFHAAVSLGFALVGLVAIGGELLGSERRGSGARWLERLPSGLACAFRAKLVFFALTLTLTTAYGYGVGWLLGTLRDAHDLKERHLVELLGLLAALVVTLGAWTFAASAWALRGGLSLMASALVLAILGLPVWRVIEAGYDPRADEIGQVVGLLVAAALLAAWLGFVRGARLGRGLGFSALFGLAPALPALLVLGVGSERKLAEREAFDPLAPSFHAASTWVTTDGRFALVAGENELRRWSRGTRPLHALRVDLEHGTHEVLGRMTHTFVRFRPSERGLYELADFVFAREGREPLVFDAETGATRAWDPAQPEDDEWKPRGLGIERFPGNGSVRTLWDPFRGREYPVAILGDAWYSDKIFVRPGRWLYSPSPVSWLWFDPGTSTHVPTGWPAHTQPLVLLEDGRILLADDSGLRWIHPEEGTSETIECGGLSAADVRPNENGARIPLRWRDDPASPERTIVLRTFTHAWLVLEEGAREARLVPVADEIRLLGLHGPDEALVLTAYFGGAFARLDLHTGALTTLWPHARTP